jgi:hypothetical protein
MRNLANPMTNKRSSVTIKKIAPWTTRLLAILVVGSIGFTLSQALFYSSPADLLDGKTKPEDLSNFTKSHSKQQILDLIAIEKQGLAKSPLEINFLKNLTALNSMIGEKTNVEKMTEVIASRTLQDKAIQITALDQYIKLGDYPKALAKLDVLTRLDPQLSAEYANVIGNIAAGPDGLNAVVDYFVAHPKWRDSLINYLTTNEKQDVNLIYSMFTKFKVANAPPTRSETQALLRRLIADKTYDKAYFVWLDQLNENELRKVSGVFDGGFEFDFGDRFFDWTYAPLVNVQATIVPRDGTGNDRVLAVDFSSGRTAFAQFSQLLRLSAGEYVLTGESKAENLQNDRGMVWRVYCVPVAGTALTTTDVLMGTQAWSAFTSKFTVPSENCETQLLRLELNALAVVDTQISGRVLYDNLKIEGQNPIDAAQ